MGPEAEEVESAVGADEPAPEIRFLVEVGGMTCWSLWCSVSCVCA